MQGEVTVSDLLISIIGRSVRKLGVGKPYREQQSNTLIKVHYYLQQPPMYVWEPITRQEGIELDECVIRCIYVWEAITQLDKKALNYEEFAIIDECVIRSSHTFLIQ